MQHRVGGLVTGQALLREVLVAFGQTFHLGKPERRVEETEERTENCRTYLELRAMAGWAAS